MNQITEADKQAAIGLLHDGGHSCVICTGSRMHTFGEPGVKDLMRLLHEEPGLLGGAFIADKVVGKGAAALMVLGGIAEVYADVVSTPARRLLEQYGIAVSFGVETRNIINRTGDGLCPVEQSCLDCTTAEACLEAMKQFFKNRAK